MCKLCMLSLLASYCCTLTAHMFAAVVCCSFCSPLYPRPLVRAHPGIQQQQQQVVVRALLLLTPPPLPLLLLLLLAQPRLQQ